MVIHKQVIQLTGRQILRMPANATVLTAQFQDNNLCVWYSVHDIYNDDEIDREFYVVGTGWDVDDERIYKFDYVNTVQQDNFVWHVYAERV